MKILMPRDTLDARKRFYKLNEQSSVRSEIMQDARSFVPLFEQAGLNKSMRMNGCDSKIALNPLCKFLHIHFLVFRDHHQYLNASVI